MVRTLAATLMIASLALLASCANKGECCDDTKSAAAAKPGEKVAVVNTICPLEGDEWDGKQREAELVRTVNGQSIGFCCEGCVKKFDKLSDEKKGAVASAAAANKQM